MKKRSTNEFLRDVQMRQRNIVFPDTVWNEARGWRNLMTQKGPLRILQVVGVLIFGLAALAMLYMMGKEALTQFHETPGTGLGRVVAGFGGYVILLALCGAA